MATAEVDSFESQLIYVETDIETQFNILIECLRERKKELLGRLKEIRDNYKKEMLKQKESLSELDRALKANQENIRSVAGPKDTQNILIESIKKKREEIQNELNTKRISFDFDNTLLDNIKYFGNITVVNSTDSCLPVMKYKDKERPVMSIGDTAGDDVGQFNYPWGVEVDIKTGNIYVADYSNNRIKMYDTKSNHVSNFAVVDSPKCIAISEDKVFVSQEGLGSFSVFDMNGTLLKRIGTPGAGDGQFKNARGIAISESNGDIYVCDLFNKRIQIFSKDYAFKSQFGSNIINSPSDIQLTKDNIYVLSHQNPFLFIFNYSYQYLQSNISTSLCPFIKRPFAFKIDGAGNFAISDDGNNSIFIFDNNFSFLHQIKVGSAPRGVTIDSNGQLIVVGYNHRLFVF